MAEEKTVNVEAVEESEDEMRAVRVAKLDELVARGENPYEETRFIRSHFSTDIKSNVESLSGKKVSIAGRLMSKRIMGKASFAHVLDGEGQIQLYLKVDALGDKYADFKKYDIGDIVGVEGEVFVTHKGEVSVAVTNIKLLSKALLPLPEKWHGLKDNDQIGRAHV